MPNDDLFKRYLEIGASMLGMTRERAEGIVRDLVASGEVARNQATKAADWLVERGRAGTEELNELVRREIRQQVTALGLATRDDVARLEAQIEELKAATAAAATATTAPEAPAKKAAAKRAAAKKAAAKKAAVTDPPGTRRSASVGTDAADGAPATGAAPPKG